MLHQQYANQAVSQTYVFFSPQIFFFSISWERNHHFWLLVVLVHVLRIVDKLKCLCSGLQHSQSSFSYERDASSEWTLATLGITPLRRDVPATRKWTTRHFSTPEQPPYPPTPDNVHNLYHLPTAFIFVAYTRAGDSKKAATTGRCRRQCCGSFMPSRFSAGTWNHLEPYASRAFCLCFTTFRKSLTIYIKTCSSFIFIQCFSF